MRIAPKAPIDRAKNTAADAYLHTILQSRDNELGFEGDFMFRIDAQVQDGSFEPVLGIQKLTHEAALKLFNQFDEGSVMFTVDGRTNGFKIGVYNATNTIQDFNILPNVFTDIEKLPTTEGV
jgi:hypothetical protein